MERDDSATTLTPGGPGTRRRPNLLSILHNKALPFLRATALRVPKLPAWPGGGSSSSRHSRAPSRASYYCTVDGEGNASPTPIKPNLPQAGSRVPAKDHGARWLDAADTLINLDAGDETATRYDLARPSLRDLFTQGWSWPEYAQRHRQWMLHASCLQSMTRQEEAETSHQVVVSGSDGMHADPGLDQASRPGRPMQPRPRRPIHVDQILRRMQDQGLYAPAVPCSTHADASAIGSQPKRASHPLERGASSKACDLLESDRSQSIFARWRHLSESLEGGDEAGGGHRFAWLRAGGASGPPLPCLALPSKVALPLLHGSRPPLPPYAPTASSSAALTSRPLVPEQQESLPAVAPPASEPPQSSSRHRRHATTPYPMRQTSSFLEGMKDLPVRVSPSDPHLASPFSTTGPARRRSLSTDRVGLVRHLQEAAWRINYHSPEAHAQVALVDIPLAVFWRMPRPSSFALGYGERSTSSLQIKAIQEALASSVLA